MNPLDFSFGFLPVVAEFGFATERPLRLAQSGLVFLKAVKRFHDRKSTRLNSSHVRSSYAVFGLKKKSAGVVLCRRSRLHRLRGTGKARALGPPPRSCGRVRACGNSYRPLGPASARLCTPTSGCG